MLLIVQTMNLSMNSIDFYTHGNDTSNSADNEDYVDSMIEFLVENVLGYSKDTFHDKANADNFSRQQQNNAHFDLKWVSNSVFFTANHELANEIVNIVPQNDRIINLYFKEVPAKPPQILSV
jgi:hypothetical protein